MSHCFGVEGAPGELDEPESPGVHDTSSASAIEEMSRTMGVTASERFSLFVEKLMGIPFGRLGPPAIFCVEPGTLRIAVVRDHTARACEQPLQLARQPSNTVVGRVCRALQAAVGRICSRIYGVFQA